jgi:hypothetical protein
MHDNLKMHVVCGGKMQYPHYDPNSHYVWERKMWYQHDNFLMWGKMQYPHYDPNPHYIWEKKMEYLHDNLKMHNICGGKM